MHAHYFQHVPFEGLGSIATWLSERSAVITSTQFYQTAEFPPLNEIDILIVMGGPMSIHDENEFPWLAREKQFIRTAIAAGKPVLGVCLGAQLIASAMGANVYRNRTKEIGWFPIYGQASATPAVFAFPESVTVFHWHGETFELPVGAVRLAHSNACENQGFQLGSSVIGLQFHLETTPESARTLINHCRHELLPSAYVQRESELLAVTPATYQTINKLMGQVLSFLCGR